MLKGYIKYGDYRYEIVGVDTVASLNLKLSSPLTEVMAFLDPDNKDLAYNSKRVEFKNANMMIESERDPSTDKRFKPNLEFFASLGLIFKTCKLNCVNKNAVLGLSVGQFDARIHDDYEVDFGGNTAYITLTYSRITKFIYEGYGFTIELIDEEPAFYEKAYKTTKENVQVKFKQNDMLELFGFEYTTKSEELIDFTNINSGSPFYETLEEIQRAYPDKDFSWLLDRDYQIVTDDTLEETIEYLSKFKTLAMDTETTGLQITFKSRTREHDQCVGIIITGKQGESFYFPMRHTKFDNLCGGDDWYFMEQYIKPLMEEKDVVVHNATFDWKVIFIYGIATNIIMDTMVAIQVTLTAKYKTKYGLKAVVEQLLKRDSLELDHLCKSGDFNTVDETFADLPKELVRLYACADADNTLAILEYIKTTKLLEEYEATKVVQFESIFACVISYHEFHGQFIDVNKTNELVNEIEQGLESSEHAMQEVLASVGYNTSSFNPRSPKEMMAIIYELLGAPEQKNLQGKRTADKNARKTLLGMEIHQDKNWYKFVSAYKEYADYDTLRKNFTKNLGDLFTPDGFSFSGVDQFKNTGRVSTRDPNYQSYNDVIKKYIEPRDGFYMGDSDYSSIEYRIIASLSGQERLIEAFKDPNTDYHKLQASNMFNVPYELVTKDLRGSAKAFNFGLPFGMGDAKFGLNLFGSVSNANTRKAAEFRRLYFKGQEKVEKFFADAQSNALKNSFSETHYKRRRYYNRETTDSGSIKRQGGNQVIQGTAADIYKIACVRLFLRIIREGWLDKVLFSGFIHDELLTEVSKEIHPLHWMKVLKEETELEIEGFCPIYLGMGFGRSWVEAKSVEIPVHLQTQLAGNLDEFPNWDGNIDEFAEWVPKRIEQFEFETIDEFLTNAENQGKLISSVVYDYLQDRVTGLNDDYLKQYIGNATSNEVTLDKSIWTLLRSQGGKLFRHPENEDALTILNAYCDKKGLERQFVSVQLEGKEDDVFDISNLQVLISLYCSYRGIDRDVVNIKSPDEVEKKAIPQNERATTSTYDSFHEQDISDEEKAKELFITRITEYASHLDTSEGTAYFKYDSSVMNILQKYINKDGNGYKVAFYEIGTDKRYITNSTIESKKLSLAQRELMLVTV